MSCSASLYFKLAKLYTGVVFLFFLCILPACINLRNKSGTAYSYEFLQNLGNLCNLEIV